MLLYMRGQGESFYFGYVHVYVHEHVHVGMLYFAVKTQSYDLSMLIGTP
jgi:hypothetical protein